MNDPPKGRKLNQQQFRQILYGDNPNYQPAEFTNYIDEKLGEW